MLENTEPVLHLEASYYVVEQIIEETPVEAFNYLEEQGVLMEEYLEILLCEADSILIGSTKTIKPVEVYVRDFCEKWDEYLLTNEYGYFLCSAMRGLGLIENGPEIRLTAWNIELALLFEEHPTHSLNVSRGQGKSWFCILFFLYLAYRYRKKKGSKFTKFSMAENLIIFASDDLSKQHIRQLTAWIEGNYIIWRRLAKGRGYDPSATLLRLTNGSQIIARASCHQQGVSVVRYS